MKTPNQADRKQDRLPDGGDEEEDEEEPPVPIPTKYEDMEQAIASYQYEQYKELAQISGALQDIARDLSWLAGRMDEADGKQLPQGAAEGTKEPTKGPRMQAQEDLEKALSANGIDIDNVKVISITDDRLFRLKAGDDLSNEPGTPWREWTSNNFGKGAPGDIKWAEYENEDGSGYYPEGFEIKWDAIEEVA